MNPWATFTVDRPNKNSKRLFNVSGYIDLDSLAKKAVKRAIKTGEFSHECVEVDRPRPLSPTYLRSSKWYLDVQCNKFTGRSSLFDRLGGYEGVRKFVALMAKEAKSDRSIGNSSCNAYLQSERGIQYICYLLGSRSPDDERVALDVTLQAKETIEKNSLRWTECNVSWAECIDAAKRCATSSMKELKLSNDIRTEVGILITCLRNKFFSSAPQRRKVDCRILVRSDATFYIPIDVTDATATIICKTAREFLDGPLKKCFAKATVVVNDVSLQDEKSCVIKFSVVPVLFEYIDVIKQHDLEECSMFMHHVTARIVAKYAALISEYQEMQRQKRMKELAVEEKAKEVKLEFDAENQIEMAAEFECEKKLEIVLKREFECEKQLEIALKREFECGKHPEIALKREDTAGYELYTPKSFHSPLPSVRCSESDFSRFEEMEKNGYQLFVEGAECELSVIRDVDVLSDMAEQLHDLDLHVSRESPLSMALTPALSLGADESAHGDCISHEAASYDNPLPEDFLDLNLQLRSLYGTPSGSPPSSVRTSSSRVNVYTSSGSAYSVRRAEQSSPSSFDGNGAHSPCDAPSSSVSNCDASIGEVAESFEESLAYLCRKHNIDIRQVAQGMYLSARGAPSQDTPNLPLGQNMLQLILDVPLSQRTDMSRVSVSDSS